MITPAVLKLPELSQIKTVENLENTHNPDEAIDVVELPDEWWYRVYLGVIISNIVVILALWSFTKYFSS